MARFSYQQQLATAAGVPACRAAVDAELEAMGARIESTNSEIRARMGSQLKLRLFGAYLAPRSAYPLAISAEVRDQGDRRVIAVETAEAFGFGTLWPAEDRYRAYCQDVLSRLSQALSTRLPGDDAIGEQD